MKKFTNSWFKGWNRDRAKGKYGNENYYYAENLRLNDRTPGSTFDLTTIDGNDLTNSIDGSYRIYTYTVLRDNIYLLAIHGLKSSVSDLTHPDKLYKFYINSNGQLDIVDYAGTVTSNALYTGDLGLVPNSNFKKIVGRYESPTIQKVYWTSGESIKFANVAIDITGYTSNKFNIIPSATPGSVTINSLGIGDLSSGVVQYAYQLYNLNGATTSFIGTSYLVPLSAGSQSVTPDSDFLGSTLEESANKSVTFTISSIDYTNFNRIKIVRILYTSLLSDPTITYIADLNSQSSITYTDTGSDNLGSITIEEFNFINYQFNCNTLEVKNNILFAGGITEQNYDPTWDSRAYRFNNYGSCTVYDSLGVTPLTFTTGSWNSVPATHDCFNKHLNSIPASISGPAENFKYKSNGTTFGAEGPNVEIDISATSLRLDDNISGTQYNNITSDRNSNAVNNSIFLFYQRDEIYAFAIELISNKGIRSAAKWVCDFKMPNMSDLSAYQIATQYPGYLQGVGLHLIFAIKNLPSDCVGYRILRCERTSTDRTILAQGIVDCAVTHTLFPAVKRPGTTLVSIKEYKDTVNNKHLGSSQLLDRTILQLYSPEISYNKNLSYTPGDFVEIIGYATMNKHYTKTSVTGAFVDEPSTYNYDYNTSINVKKITTVAPLNRQSLTISEGKLISTVPYKSHDFGDTQFSVSVAGDSYINSSHYGFGTGNNAIARGNTKFVVKTSSTVTNISAVSDTSGYGLNYMVFNYRRPAIQYGGNSYQNRMNRSYIPCTSYISSSIPTIDVYNGDTFVDYFECSRSMLMGLDTEATAGYPMDENMCETICFPVETSIHAKWANYTTFNKNYSLNDSWLYQETAGLYTKTISGIVHKYEQYKDLYSYNSVYSTNGYKLIKSYPKNDLVSNNKVFDSRIQWSERKYNNELIDSWTTWKSLNYKDVDNQYGQIQELINYNTRLLYFQPTGVGVLSVDERELTSGTNSSQLILGTGSVGQRYDYISTACGTLHPDSIIPCKAGLYWYDRYNNAFFVYEPTGNIDNVTKLSGIQSYLYDNITDNSTISNVVTGYDPKYNEVLFSFITTDNWGFNKKTIVYNELSKIFIGTFSFEPKYYINVPNYYYSTNNLSSIYKHNEIPIGQDKCTFYGATYYAILEAIVNPEGSSVVRFDILEWTTECTDILGTNNVTFSRIGANTDYTNLSNMAYMGVNTGTIQLTPSNMVQRFRTYRFNQLRDVATFERMKDYYLKVRFLYDSTASSTAVFKIHNLVTTYEQIAPY